MLTINYGTIEDSRQRTLEKLTKLRGERPYTVIDVGGSAGGSWSSSVTDMVIDINASGPDALNIDVCDYDSWKELESIVAATGKFNYSICTHTLEDLYDPIITLKKLPRIAERGIISMPSILTELSNIESSMWLGYIHHRWIFHEENGKILIIPKLPLIESVAKNRFKPKAHLAEITFEWENEINYTMFMNNYLGPNANTVLREFCKLIDKVHKL